MTYLMIGMLLFGGVHLFPSAVALRQGMISRLGENGYKGVFSLISFAGLGLMIFGYAHAGKVDIYVPIPGLRSVTVLLMALSMVLFAAANMPTNIKRVTRHPMLWGLVVWSVAHLLANGDQASLVLFGGLGVYGLLGMLSANLRGAQKQQQKVPFAKDVMTVAGGLIVFVVIFFAHPWLFGVTVL